MKMGSNIQMEPLKIRHDTRGLVSMWNVDVGMHNSQFFITFLDCTWMDGQGSVFGKIVEGIEVIDELEKGIFYKKQLFL